MCMGNTPQVLLDAYISKCDPRRQSRLQMQEDLHGERVDASDTSESSEEDAHLSDLDEMNDMVHMGSEDEGGSQSTGADSIAYESCLHEDGVDSPANMSMSLKQLLPSAVEPVRRQGREIKWVKLPGKPYMKLEEAKALSIESLKKVFLRMYGGHGRGNNKEWYVRKITGTDAKERKEKVQQSTKLKRRMQSQYWLK